MICNNDYRNENTGEKTMKNFKQKLESKMVLKNSELITKIIETMVEKDSNVVGLKFSENNKIFKVIFEFSHETNLLGYEVI